MVSEKNKERYIYIADRVSELRKEQGLSQHELAEKSNISISLLRAIESPSTQRSFSLYTLFNVADALEIEPSQLIYSSK